MTLKTNPIRYNPDQPNQVFSTTNCTEVDKKTALALYTFIVRLRRIEEELIKEYHPADDMRCPVHFCIGQESIPAALSMVLDNADPLFSHHRSHGYFYAKGGNSREFFAELYGKITGTNSGKGGSQGVSVPSRNFFTGAILTGGVALAAGAGLSIKMSKDKRCAVAGFGEAATDQGIFWEAANYITLHNLPVLLVCENNIYSTYSPQHKRSGHCNISERAASFGLDVKTIFGNDVIGSYQIVKKAVDDIRSGKGPVFIEAFTYRWNGHVGPEDDDYIGYRDPAEIEFWKKHCPLSLLEKDLLKAGVLSEKIKKETFELAEAEIADAFDFAKKSPFPDVGPFEPMNYAKETPLADKLLSNENEVQFNETQPELVPGPY